ncbi:MAG: hypothetical protein HZA54_04080 [Planctomycetes bacterium]|nr:hypothetical protein [Planctomycetota bacterium]
MPTVVRCQCGLALEAPDHLAGRSMECPKCHQPIHVPGNVAMLGLTTEDVEVIGRKREFGREEKTVICNACGWKSLAEDWTCGGCGRFNREFMRSFGTFAVGLVVALVVLTFVGCRMMRLQTRRTDLEREAGTLFQGVVGDYATEKKKLELASIAVKKRWPQTGAAREWEVLPPEWELGFFSSHDDVDVVLVARVMEHIGTMVRGPLYRVALHQAYTWEPLLGRWMKTGVLQEVPLETPPPSEIPH